MCSYKTIIKGWTNLVVQYGRRKYLSNWLSKKIVNNILKKIIDKMIFANVQINLFLQNVVKTAVRR